MRSKTIAIIQGDPAEAAAARLALADSDCHVRVARDAAEFALQMHREGPPDLVVTALRLPFMDGLQIARSLKACATLRHIPIVMVEAGLSAPEVAAAHRAGCVAVFPKRLRAGVFAAL